MAGGIKAKGSLNRKQAAGCLGKIHQGGFHQGRLRGSVRKYWKTLVMFNCETEGMRWRPTVSTPPPPHRSVPSHSLPGRYRHSHFKASHPARLLEKSSMPEAACPAGSATAG